MSIWDEIRAEQANVTPGTFDGFVRALDRAYDSTFRQMPDDEFRANLVRLAACAVALVEDIDKDQAQDEEFPEEYRRAIVKRGWPFFQQVAGEVSE